MTRYLLLNIAFMLVVGGLLLLLRPSLDLKRVAKTAAVLLIMTAVFDTIMIALDLFSYEAGYILGIHIGKAPIEDFAYPLLAAVMIPILWEYNKHQ